MTGDDTMIGQIVDRYSIESRLGTGGFGDVFRAKHLVTGRQVALKMLRPDRSTDEVTIQRFMQEARAAAAAQTAHIVQVLDAGTTGEGICFLALEFVEGDNLRVYLEKETPVRTTRAIDFILQILSALQAAHSVGVVHRDLKPANIIVSMGKDGRPLLKLVDFGVSKFRSDEISTGITKAGMIVGTPAYMAPEQFRASKDVDGRADLFSASVIMYELLSGQLPYHADSYETLIVRMHTEPPQPLAPLRPDLPPGLCMLVERGLSRDPDGRWQSADEMANALQKISVGDMSPLHLNVTAARVPVPPTPMGNAFAPTMPLDLTKLPSSAPPPPLHSQSNFPSQPPVGLSSAPLPAYAGPPQGTTSHVGQTKAGSSSLGFFAAGIIAVIGAVVVGLGVYGLLMLLADEPNPVTVTETPDTTETVPVANADPPPDPNPAVMIPNPTVPPTPTNPTPTNPTPTNPTPTNPTPANPTPTPPTNPTAPTPTTPDVPPGPANANGIRMTVSAFSPTISTAEARRTLMPFRSQLARCRGAQDEDFTIQILFAQNGSVLDSSPHPTGGTPAARCGAAVFSHAEGNHMNGIVRVQVYLPAR